MSPTLAKAMGGSLAKNVKKTGLHQQISQTKKQQDIQDNQIPQQMNPPAPLMSQHPNDRDQQMVSSDDQNEMIEQDERMQAEKDILNTHLEAVREEAQLIQREGEMITTLELAFLNEEEYDMREYLSDARQIVMRKFQMYSQLQTLIDKFQGDYLSK